MATLFSKIIAGDIPCHKIAEDQEFFAFLDIRPLALGHTLVVPKEETDYLFDLDDCRLGRMMVFAKKIAAALQKAVPSQRIGLAVMGLEIPHAHIHLVPIRTEADMFFGNPRLEPVPEELALTAEKIRQAFN